MFSLSTGIFLLHLLLFTFPCFSSMTAPMDKAGEEITPKTYSYTWQKFEMFLDASRGSNISRMSELKKYFHHFGYLEAQDMTNFSNLFDAEFEHALMRYQAKLGLPITGTLDSQTLTQIMSPRCGVRDHAQKRLHATRNFEYFPDQPRWARDVPMTLSYSFSPINTITSLTMANIRDAFERAFGHWSSVIPLTFWETDDYGFADIKIGFYSGDHGDGEAFDGVLGVLGHAFSPESGRFHLDAAETWAVDFDAEKSNVAVDLESVATHEIGHLLGLAHTSVKDAVMYPSLKPREKKVDLKLDDIEGIQALYGSNPNFNIKALSESDISSNDAAAIQHLIRTHCPSTMWFVLIMAMIPLILIQNS